MSQKNILVVDDEDDVLSLLQDALTAADYNVDTARSAQDALQLATDNLYDAAIVDFGLPDMNGVILHTRLKQVDTELAERTLFISGLAQSETRMEYYALGGSGFIAKPFNVADIVRRIRALTS